MTGCSTTLRIALAAFAGLAGCVLGAPPVDAASEINVTTRYYDVAGDSVDELRAQMRELGPYSDRAEGHVPARMELQVDFRFVSQWRRGRCRVEQVRVRADITYRYPRWDGAFTRDDALADRWNNYIASLVVHEQGHGAIVVDAMAEVEEALASTPPSRNCAALRATARARGVEVLERTQEAQIEYDRETGGGAEQGATLRRPDDHDSSDDQDGPDKTI